jgi:hypothetical protein
VAAPRVDDADPSVHTLINDMHTFYYVICVDPQNPNSQAQRVERIKTLTNDAHSFKIDICGNCKIIKVEIEEDESATQFKLAAEKAIREIHS